MAARIPPKAASPFASFGQVAPSAPGPSTSFGAPKAAPPIMLINPDAPRIASTPASEAELPPLDERLQASNRDIMIQLKQPIENGVVANGICEPQSNLIQSKDATAILDGLINGSQYRDNILSRLPQTAYHWRLFMTRDVDQMFVGAPPKVITDLFKKVDAMQQVTIAETALTTYDISDVEVKAAVGSDFQSRSSRTTEITMTIVEPNGVSFLDSLRNAAGQVNVRNYMKCPYYLELTFKGYNDDGTIVPSIHPDDQPNGGRWLYSVQITNIETNLTAGGGSYVLTMIPMANIAFDNKFHNAPEMFVARGGTVGEMFRSVADCMNKTWAKRLGDPKNEVVKFDFKFHKIAKDGIVDPDTMQLKPEKIEFNHIRDLGMDVDNDVPTLHVPRGTSISQIADTIFSNCETAQKLAKDSKADDNSPDDSADRVNAKGYRESLLLRAEPDVQTTGYDFLTGEYCHAFTYHIFGFETQSPILSRTQVKNASDPTVQKAMVTSLAGKGFLRKRYDYLYSGLNTEVLDFDLKFNMKWAVALPRLINYNFEQNITHSKYDRAARAAGFGDAMDRYTQAYDELQKSTEDAQALKDSKTASAADISKADLDVAKKKQVLAEQSAVIRSARIDAKKEFLSKHPYDPSLDSKRDFAEDLSQDTLPNPISIIPSGEEEAREQSGDGMVGQSHPGKAIYGTILNQVYGMITDQFQQIDLEIRGDPYWIGPGSFEESISRNNDTPIHSSYVDYRSGANTFLLEFRYPVKSDSDGAPVLQANETVTGIYQVATIVHSFKNGQFTQRVSALRLPLIDVLKSLNFSKVVPDVVPSKA
jgi:hypothetical protein